MNTKTECRNCNDYGYTLLRDRTGGSTDGTWKEPCPKCNPNAKLYLADWSDINITFHHFEWNNPTFATNNGSPF